MRTIFTLAIICMLWFNAAAFEAKLFCSKSENIFDQWKNILPERPPFIPICSEVVKNEPFVVYISYFEPSIRDGKIKISAKITLTDPAGKEKMVSVCKTEEVQCSSAKQVFLLRDYLRGTFDPPDALGSYVFSVTLKDENSGKQIQAQTTLKLVENYSGKILPDPLKAMGNYYSEPAPQNIIPAFKQFIAKIPELSRKNNFNPIPILALFYYALAENPQVWDEFIKYTGAIVRPELKQLGVIIIHELDAKLFSQLSESDQKHWNPQNAGIFRVNAITNAIQLDILWSEFFITGKVKPVIQIANAIANVKNNISIEDFKKIPAPTMENKQSLMLYLTGVAANWSITSNAKQHRLVNFYLEVAVARNEFKDELVKTTIAKAIKINSAP